MDERRPAGPDPAATGRRSARGAPVYPVAAVLALLVLSVYWQAGGHDFVNIDDGAYVTENPFVLRGLTLEGISRAFTTFHASNWHPLTWISHMVDVELFGPSPGWHHRVSVLLHLLNTELLFLVLWRMTGGLWPSAFVAALFGVHPLHVESVAWVAERKDVLSTLFWILTMGAYLRYVRRPGAGRYLLVTATFALGLMCKPMLVTLPFALLLLDFWPLGRLAPSGPPDVPSWRPSVPAISRLAWEKVPLLALSAISCAVTYLAQAGGHAVLSFDYVPFASRLANASVSYGTYLWETAWPSSLAVFYPHPATFHAGAPAWAVAGSLSLLCGASAAALWLGRRRPCVAVGWLWYVGTLVPVVGLVQVGGQAHADRYTYVPLIGVFIAVAWGVPPLLSGRRSGRVLLAAFAAVSLAALSAAAWVQAGYWRNSVTLLSRAVAVTHDNWFAWNNLGVAYNELGRYREAIGCFGEALRIRPDHAEALNNLGVSSNGLGQFPQAIGYFRDALRVKPDHAEAWNNLGVSHGGLGRDREAIGYFREALRLEPGNAVVLNNLGVSCNRLGLYREAIDHFRNALRIRPDYAEALNNLGVSFCGLGQYQRAAGHFGEAVRIAPDYAEGWYNLGVSYRELGQLPQAIGCFREALRIRPDYPEARENLAAAMSGPGPSR